MSRIWLKMPAARAASPSPSTCSAIASKGSISAFQRLRLAFRRKLREQLVEGTRQLALGAILGEVGDRLALEHRIDGRHRLDAELGGDQLVLVDVDPRQGHALGGIIGGDLVEDRVQLLARPAPGRR